MRRDKLTGVESVVYSILSRHHLRIDDESDVTIVNVQLHCDLELTPWEKRINFVQKHLTEYKQSEIYFTMTVRIIPTIESSHYWNRHSKSRLSVIEKLIKKVIGNLLSQSNSRPNSFV
jgi:hypothetical protein